MYVDEYAPTDFLFFYFRKD